MKYLALVIRSHCILAALILFLTSCTIPGGPGGYLSERPEFDSTSVVGKITAENSALSDQLQNYADVFAITMMTAADQIVEASDDTKVQKEARLWALRMVPQCNVLAHSQSPRVGLVDLAVLVSSQREQINSASGEACFKEHVEIARGAAKKCYDALWELVSNVMEQGDAELLLEQVNLWLANNENDGFLEFQRMVELSEERKHEGAYRSDSGRSGFFRDMNRNISGTAYELNQLNRQIELLNHFAQHSPTYVRWSVESLIYDVSTEGYQIGQLAQDIERMNRSLEEIASASKELPEEQQQTIRLLRDETLDKVESVVDRLFLKTIALIFIVLLLIFIFQAGLVVLRKRLHAPNTSTKH